LGCALGNVGHLRRALLPEQRKVINEAKGRSPASHEGLAKEALQQLFSCIEASTPPRIVVVGPITVGPTIIAVVGVMIRSIVGPVIATVTIAAMPDFLYCSSTKLA
jgi:hypothetical protein